MTQQAEKWATAPSDAAFSVSAIGSCRVVGPLRHAQASGNFTLNQRGIYGYCHAAPEALQVLHLMASGVPIPDYLLPVISPGKGSGRLAKAAQSDFYFIEICSAKELSVDSYHVQLNYLTQHLAEFFDQTPLAKTYWRLTHEDDRVGRLEFLKNLEVYNGLRAEDQHILAELKMRTTTPASLRAAIDEIKVLTPDQLFVTHFNAQKNDGAVIRSRARFIEMLTDELRAAKANVFDPSDYVSATGQKLALADGGASLSHYSEDFETFLAENWTTRYIEPRRQRKLSMAAMPNQQTNFAAHPRGVAQGAPHKPQAGQTAPAQLAT